MPGNRVLISDDRWGELAPHHVELLRARAVSPEVARARGYRTVVDARELAAAGFPPGQAAKDVPCLFFPRYGLDGRPTWPKVRPDRPRYRKDGSPIKYDTPTNSWAVVDCLPVRLEQLAVASDVMVSVEGFIKGDAMVSAGAEAVVSIDGIWGWSSNRKPLLAWEVLCRRRRTFHLVADSDFVSSDQVAGAVSRLADHLQGLGAQARVLHPPAGEGKVGIDDWLALGGGLDELVDVPAAVVTAYAARRQTTGTWTYSPELADENPSSWQRAAWLIRKRDQATRRFAAALHLGEEEL